MTEEITKNETEITSEETTQEEVIPEVAKQEETFPEEAVSEEEVQEEAAPDAAEKEEAAPDAAEKEEVAPDAAEKEEAALEEEVREEAAHCKKSSCGLKVFLAILSVILIVLLTLFFTPRVKYLWAMHLVNSGDYQAAHDILTGIKDDYKKAEDELKRFIEISQAQETSVAFGSQPQSEKSEFKYDFSKKNYYKKTTTKNGSTTHEEYFLDNNGNVIKVIVKDDEGTVRQTVKIKYDKNGNIIEQTVDQNGQKQEVKITKPGLRYVKK